MAAPQLVVYDTMTDTFQSKEEIEQEAQAIYESICKLIKDRRKEMRVEGKKLTQTQAAEAAFLHPRTPSTIENASNKEITTIIQYAIGLGLSFEEIVLQAALVRQARRTDLSSVLKQIK